MAQSPAVPLQAVTPYKPARVAYFARGGMIDGAGRQLLYLLQHLDRRRFMPLVLLDGGGPLQRAIEALGVPVQVTPMRPWRSVRGWPMRYIDARRARQLAQAHGVQLVHCSDTWRTPYAARVARQLNVPLVAHVRGPTRPRDLHKNHCTGADAIIGIAERYRAEIVRAGYPAGRVSIIDDAVDVSLYRRDAAAGAAFRHMHAASDTVAVIGLVGRIEPLKRVREFVEVVAQLPRSPNIKVLLIGSTQRSAYVSEVQADIQRFGLAGQVQTIGRQEDMPAVYSGLDLLVTLSGGSMMFEAMACGTAVLSIRADGRHSQHTRHDETAWCVSGHDPSPAAKALAVLLEDHALRQRLAVAGQRHVAAVLNPQCLTDRVHAIYEGVLSARSAVR